MQRKKQAQEEKAARTLAAFEGRPMAFEPLTTFFPFEGLPREIRQLIWDYADGHTHRTSPKKIDNKVVVWSSVPAILHATQDSRRQAFKCAKCRRIAVVSRTFTSGKKKS
jgi:hypothetical protein